MFLFRGRLNWGDKSMEDVVEMRLLVDLHKMQLCVHCLPKICATVLHKSPYCGRCQWKQATIKYCSYLSEEKLRVQY